MSRQTFPVPTAVHPLHRPGESESPERHLVLLSLDENWAGCTSIIDWTIALTSLSQRSTGHLESHLPVGWTCRLRPFARPVV